MEYVLLNGELYHHGTKGMRWGVRRYQNADGSLTAAGKKRVKEWRSKEVQKIAKRQLKQLDKDEKAINKQARKYDRMLDERGSDAKTYKQAAKYVRTKADAIIRDEISKAEAKRVMNMSLSDISAEKKIIGKKTAEAVLASVGSSIVFTAAGAPFAPVYFPKVKNIKTNSRVDNETRVQIEVSAYAEAAKDVYG